MGYRICMFMVLAAIAFLALPATATAAQAPDVVSDCDRVAEWDRIRIQAHFDEVEEVLRSRDVSHLSPELQEARRKNLDELVSYREAGEFPRNTYVPHRQPVFIDGDDRRCAVGHLMIESGFEEEARRISERENLAYLLEMESPEVEQWVALSGLTAEEAAWIQPGYSSCYDSCPCDIQPVCGEDGSTYVNPCFAESCGHVEKWYQGCCVDGDEVENSNSPGYGFTQTSCDEDPNEDDQEHCPAGQAITEPHEEDWEYASACSGIAGAPLNNVPALVVMAFALIFGVRPSPHVSPA